MRFRIVERLIVESKEDIDRFIDKFGEKNYEWFRNSNQRLKNANRSTDITWYVKNVSKEELEDLLSKLQRRLKVDNEGSSGEKSTGIRGKYEYLGEGKGYKVYRPLDYLASIDLGYMSGWCTTGRYGHSGERDCKPSEEAAKQHFNDYTEKGINLYYFLDSKSMEGKYAIAVYPKELEVEEFISEDTYIKSTNFEIFNQEDEIEYEAINKLPLDKIPQELIINKINRDKGVMVKNGKIIQVDQEAISIDIPNNVTSIGDYVFEDCIRLKSIIIPNSVTSIGSYAFYNCRSLTSITIGNSVTSIGDYAFMECSSLTSIIIPDNVVSLGSYTFQNCISLRSVTIGNSVTSIRSYAFMGCHNLTSVTIGNSVTSIGDSAFQNCRSLTSIDIPNNVTSIGGGAFWDCRSLKSITIPNSVTSIGYWAFLGCTSLVSIEIPNSVIEIQFEAFSECPEITIKCKKGSYAEKYAIKNDIPYEII